MMKKLIYILLITFITIIIGDTLDEFCDNGGNYDDVNHRRVNKKDRKPVLLLPGLGGSTLYVKTSRGDYNKIWVKQEWDDDMSHLELYYKTVNDGDGNRTIVDVSKDEVIVKGTDEFCNVYVNHEKYYGLSGIDTLYEIWPIYSYEQFAPTIEGLIANGYIPGKNLIGAPYDFRFTPYSTGDILSFKQYLNETNLVNVYKQEVSILKNKSDRQINEYFNQQVTHCKSHKTLLDNCHFHHLLNLIKKLHFMNARKKVVLVAHSNGNNVVKHLLGNIDLHNYIDQYHAVASPNRGSYKAVRAVVNGTELGGGFIVTGKWMKRVTSTWPVQFWNFLRPNTTRYMKALGPARVGNILNTINHVYSQQQDFKFDVLRQKWAQSPQWNVNTVYLKNLFCYFSRSEYMQKPMDGLDGDGTVDFISSSSIVAKEYTKLKGDHMNMLLSDLFVNTLIKRIWDKQIMGDIIPFTNGRENKYGPYYINRSKDTLLNGTRL